MEKSINLIILLPLLPLGMTSFLFILLRSFNRTVNRLTKPISYLLILSIIGSTLLSLIFLLNHVEGDVYLARYSSLFEETNLELHLNDLIEKFIIISGLISSVIILISVFKLDRKNGYVLYILNIGFITSFLIGALLFFDFQI